MCSIRIKSAAFRNGIFKVFCQTLHCFTQSVDLSQKRQCQTQKDIARQETLSCSWTIDMLQDENTRYINIGPVNKAINMLCCYFEDPDSKAFQMWALIPSHICVPAI